MKTEWVRLPTHWIEQGGLKQFRWVGRTGSDHVAALMVLAPIAHHADQETGSARVTYDVLQSAAGLSRAKVSDGLDVLARQGIITRQQDGRSSYSLIGFSSTGGWGKFPWKKLYVEDQIAAFSHFKLRTRIELEALKLYYLFVSRRDNRTNGASISYLKIEEYSGINRNNIRSPLSFLVSIGLVHIDHMRSEVSDAGVSNRYRLAGLNAYNHMGTTGLRNLTSADDDAHW